jgi:protein-S-isoprenylcysteine O-methyltransferase Ste14
MTKAEAPVKITTYCVYLASWVAFAIAALAGARPTRSRHSPATPTISRAALIGGLLQAAAAFAVTRSMGNGPLNPRPFELAGALVLAPLGAALFIWALRSVPQNANSETLVTEGAYSWLRNPIYLALLAMLLATGFLISTGTKLILPLVLYLAGSELRIASEEGELERRLPGVYAIYRSRTRWRYLPGLR